MATTTTMMSIGTGAGLGIGTGTGTVGLLSSSTATTATATATTGLISPLSRNRSRAAATNSGRSSLLFPYPCLKATRTTGRIVCEVAVGSASVEEEEEAAEAEVAASAKIGSKVKVKVPLKVYHVPRVAEVDITGMEGELKQYVALWKGKRISANLPYKIQFFVDIEGRGSVKFFVHLKEDEFEYI